MNKAAIRREQFPVTRKYIYLNHAAVGPLSERVYRAMEEHARDMRDVGGVHWRDWLAEYVQFRKEAAHLIGCTADEISILKNTTEGISFVAEGLRWEQGENVVTTDMEFPSNFLPWKRLERRGVECREMKADVGSFSVDDVERLIDAKTRVVAISSAYFHNGFVPDLKAIGELCSARGVVFFVDAIQSLGAVELNVRELGISYLAADAHKWMLGPEGTAIFYAAAEHRDRLDVLESGWMNADRKGLMIGCSTELLRDGRRFEGGTLNTNGIYGATAAMELLREVGMAEIEAEVLRLARHLSSRLQEQGFEVRTPQPQRSGIVAVDPRGLNPTKLAKIGGELNISPSIPIALLHAYLEREGVICAPREGMLRLAPHFYNTEEELDEVVELLAALR